MIGNASEQNSPRHWFLDGRNNRQLQVFIYTNEWIGITSNQKKTWIRFAQSNCKSSTLQDCGNDELEWTVTKTLAPDREMVAVKRIRIQGSSVFLRSVPEKP